MIGFPEHAMQEIAPHNGDRDLLPSADQVALLLAGYGEVRSYRDLSRYNPA